MQIHGGVASGTHVDDHGQRMDKSFLDGSVETIRAKYVPLLINHDFSQQIGIILNARVVRLHDGEYALLIANAVFESDEEAAQFLVGAENTVWSEHESILDEVEEIVRRESEHPEATPSVDELPELQSMAELLEAHLDSTEIAPDGSVYLIKRHITSVGDLEIHLYPKDFDASGVALAGR